MAEFGKILQSVGEFGLFQKVCLFALCFPNIILPFHFASVVFVESDPERHCNTNWILGAEPNLTFEEQLNLTLPREEDGTFSRCLMFTPVDRDIESIRTYGLNETAVWLSHDFRLYLVSQFIVGVGYGGFRMNAIILATEWIGISKRSWGACLSQVFFALGLCVLAGLIYFIRDWRLAQLITAAPLGIVSVYIWYIPESARWLLDSGRVKEAHEVLTKAAAINKDSCTPAVYLAAGGFGEKSVPHNHTDGRRSHESAHHRSGSRQTASGLGNIASRAGGLLSPVVNMLVTYHWFVPIAVYSSFMIVSGALGFLLPETRKRELPDSTADVGQR
uniref:Uncharacterized protein n=1 Tax=Knipowitschia caucasica TaxID=637954 RepID=A0AAV2JU27_KNICA